MGYSYLETFVYADRKFYGMKPAEFRKLVEDNNMKFLGSMTFKNLPGNSNWAETMN
jgi:AraC-like DNA-binding protein